MKILHLIIDHQVVERTMGVYEQIFPGCNEIIIFDVFNKKFKHINKLKYASVVRLGKGFAVGKQFNFTEYTHLIAHFLTMDMIDFIKSAPKELHVCWDIYGWDFYNQFGNILGLNLFYINPKRYEKYNKYYFFERFFPSIFDFVIKIHGHKYRNEKQRKDQFNYISKRIDSILACCDFEANCLMNYAKRNIPWYESFNYSLTETLGQLKDHPFYNGKDILIGNSASLSNNHLYVIEKIKNIEFTPDSRIIMPISYGGNYHYQEDIKKAYISKFGDSVEFISDYLPLYEYNKIFLRLKTMIMSAWRQESMGTIIMGLYLGIKIFLSEMSPLYLWMKKCGFIIWSLESASSEDFNQHLSNEDKIHNRNLILLRYGEDVFAETLKKIFL